MTAPPEPLILDGESLTIEKVVQAARDPAVEVRYTLDAKKRVEKGQRKIASIVRAYKGDIKKRLEPVLDYGVTTGFGEFKRVAIPAKKLLQLQVNILLSHAAGVGLNTDPYDLTNYYPADVVRAALLLRINAFLKGHSGVTMNLVERLVELFNAGVIPLVPLRGSVGSSGDLCPLAHLALVLFKEGRARTWFYQVTEPRHTISHPALAFAGKYTNLRRRSSKGVSCEVRPATELKIPPHVLAHKEGLALTNGATFSAAMLALAVYDAEALITTADVALALSVEAARGCARAFDNRVHELRGQKGQQVSAENVQALLRGSQLVETADEVQDPYSIRCGPAVHGASRDAVAFARMVVGAELNAATDNPLFLDGGAGWDAKFGDNWKHRFDAKGKRKSYDGNRRHSFSAGNFHGQPVAIAADYVAIAVAEIANISERRTQFLMDQNHNRGLPPNVIANSGLNSGFMIAQYCAAGLVSENKVFAHPASVDSIPTSSNSEDHNSMATIAAVKLRHVVSLARFALAIELLVATQAVEWAALLVHRVWQRKQRGVDVPRPVQAYRRARKGRTDLRDNASSAQRAKANTQFANAETALFTWWAKHHRGEVKAVLGAGTRAAYDRIRAIVDPMLADAVVAYDIARLATLIGPPKSGALSVELIDAVNAALKKDASAQLHPAYALSAPD